uniref:Uncharacterized protein LOC105033938 isoform X3 n=1 Tax=Elaeis guineensis var. tenera TaxID=51953 RepID=A0A8N4IB24_ELAGV|nr:uncharacterized protein LOC105033938 isoform X3 [Elaeis guineensis]
MTGGNKSMEVDSTEGSNFQTPSLKKKRLVARPVAAGSSGKGLPYAPEDWPSPGDIWRWKVGVRKTSSGYWVDRYLYPPAHFPRAPGKKLGLPSRLSVEEYIRKEFPDMSIDAFFASFIWRVPSADCSPGKDIKKSINMYASSNSLDASECSGYKSAIRKGTCKAGNKMCSLQAKTKSYGLAAKECDICCSEDGFCRDCCCILCCKTVDWTYGGYSFIRCEATVDENYICGHVAHVQCALRSYMGGTVQGDIGLDVEYYCRRCDNRTDLISHVTKLIRTCESLDSGDDIDKILNLGFCILRGSGQMRAKSLHNQIALVMAKLKQGVPLGQIWKVEDSISTSTADDGSHNGNEIKMLEALDITGNRLAKDIRNEVELSQTNDIVDGRAQMPVYMTSNHERVDQIKHEEEKLGNMMKIAKGFGQMHKTIIGGHFGLAIDD